MWALIVSVPDHCLSFYFSYGAILYFLFLLFDTVKKILYWGHFYKLVFLDTI